MRGWHEPQRLSVFYRSILQLHTQTWLPCTPVVTDDTGGMTFPRRPDQVKPFCIRSLVLTKLQIILWLAELVRRTQCGMHLAARLV